MKTRVFKIPNKYILQDSYINMIDIVLYVYDSTTYVIRIKKFPEFIYDKHKTVQLYSNIRLLELKVDV